MPKGCRIWWRNELEGLLWFNESWIFSSNGVWFENADIPEDEFEWDCMAEQVWAIREGLA